MSAFKKFFLFLIRVSFFPPLISTRIAVINIILYLFIFLHLMYAAINSSDSRHGVGAQQALIKE